MTEPCQLNKEMKNMRTAEKIALLQKLLERRYPADTYDVSAKSSIFRLRADKIINRLNKLENGGK